MPIPDTSSADVSGTTRMIDAAMTATPAPRWRNYKVTYGSTTEIWVSAERAAEIEATCETRVVRDKAGTVHQYLEVR